MLVHNVVPCIIIIGERKFKMRSADLIWLPTAFFLLLIRETMHKAGGSLVYL